MRKFVKGSLLVAMLIFGIGLKVQAEEVNQGNEKPLIAESIQKEPGQTEGTVDSSPVDAQKPTDNTKPMEKNALETEKKRLKNLLNGLLNDTNQGLINDFLSKIDQAQTLEELKQIEKEMNEIDFSMGLEIARDYGINTVLDLGRLKKLTNEQVTSYIDKLKNAKTLQEINAIVDELRPLINADGFNKKRKELPLYVQKLVKEGKLTKDQGDKFLAKIENSRYYDELVAIEAEVNNQVQLNGGQGQETFKEKYAKVENGINQYIQQGKLTKDQGDKFLAKLKTCQTIEELDALWNEVEKQVNDNATTNTKPAPKPTPVNPKLPQTGENQTILTVVIGLIIILGAGFVFFKKRRAKNS